MTLLEYGVAHGFAATGPSGSDAPLRVRERRAGRQPEKRREDTALCG
jgi:hypothetical protein